MKKHEVVLVTQEPTGQYSAFSSGFSIKHKNTLNTK